VKRELEMTILEELVMMTTAWLQGELVRLVAPEPERDAGLLAKWSRDAEYLRLLDSDPARQWSVKKYKEWIEKDLDKERSDDFFFLIQALTDDADKDWRPIGFVGLGGIRWTHGDAWVGIGIGEREYWGRGCGTEAMRMTLRFAFDELNLHRVSLTVFEYNLRAIRSYEKAGFRVEGKLRQFMRRDGRRWDLMFMGILKKEWRNDYDYTCT
jgi:RimJ/RimL family protein N-acetyltransferase